MSECCSSSCVTGNTPKKHKCPVNGREYAEVFATTIIHHIKEPWNWHPMRQGYYFCDDPKCDVVYFGQDDSVIDKSALRTLVGIKERSKNSIVCYCFGVTTHEAATNPSTKAFVIGKTKEHVCACEARNPSGRCCLSDFPTT